VPAAGKVELAPTRPHRGGRAGAFPRRQEQSPPARPRRPGVEEEEKRRRIRLLPFLAAAADSDKPVDLEDGRQRFTFDNTYSKVAFGVESSMLQFVAAAGMVSTGTRRSPSRGYFTRRPSCGRL
jgi:hypothetical protein